MDCCSLHDRGGIGLRAQPSGPGPFERPSAESAGGDLRTRCRDRELHDCLLHPLPLLGLSRGETQLSTALSTNTLTFLRFGLCDDRAFDAESHLALLVSAQ